MKHRTKEFLLAFALWVLSLLAYTCSLRLPWFTLNEGTQTQINKTVFRTAVDRSQARITGLDAFDFLLVRLEGGCFVWLAHPVLFVGWVFLVSRRWRAAAGAGCLALVLALYAPLVFQPREGPWLPASVGYYLWFASMALLACSALLCHHFLHGEAVTEKESLRRLAAQQDTFGAELAELKDQVAVLFDQQAATLLDEIEAR
jgi:hypothetical protein